MSGREARDRDPLSWGTALRVWWAFTWRWPLLMLAPLLPLAALLAVARPGPEVLRAMIPVVAWPCALLAQVWAFKMIFSPGALGTSLGVEDHEA